MSGEDDYPVAALDQLADAASQLRASRVLVSLPAVEFDRLVVAAYKMRPMADVTEVKEFATYKDVVVLERGAA